MKKIVLLCVSLVLLISSLVLGVTGNGGLTVGSGMGFNRRVRNVEELSNVLVYLLGEDSYGDSLLGINTDGKVLNLVSAAGEKHTVDLLASKNTGKKYTSATVTILSSVSSSSSCSHPEYSNGVRSTSQSLDREMTMFIGEKGTLYHSKGRSNSSRTVQKVEKVPYYDSYSGGTMYYENVTDETYNTAMDFDMKILRIGNKVYVNFQEFSYSDDDGSRQIKYANTDKWIDMPYELVKSLIDIDSQNHEVLSAFGEMLKYLIDSGEVDESDNYINLNEEDFVRLFEEFKESPLSKVVLEEGDVEFIYDLSSPSTPYISSMTVYDIEDMKVVGDGYNVTTRNKASVSQQFIIRNINNTSVSFDREKVSVKVGTKKAFDKLFMITERSKDDE